MIKEWWNEGKCCDDAKIGESSQLKINKDENILFVCLDPKIDVGEEINRNEKIERTFFDKTTGFEWIVSPSDL